MWAPAHSRDIPRRWPRVPGRRRLRRTGNHRLYSTSRPGFSAAERLEERGRSSPSPTHPTAPDAFLRHTMDETSKTTDMHSPNARPPGACSGWQRFLPCPARGSRNRLQKPAASIRSTTLLVPPTLIPNSSAMSWTTSAAAPAVRTRSAGPGLSRDSGASRRAEELPHRRRAAVAAGETVGTLLMPDHVVDDHARARIETSTAC